MRRLCTLRTVLRDAVLLLVGTVLGILVSHTVFDASAYRSGFSPSISIEKRFPYPLTMGTEGARYEMAVGEKGKQTPPSTSILRTSIYSGATPAVNLTTNSASHASSSSLRSSSAPAPTKVAAVETSSGAVWVAEPEAPPTRRPKTLAEEMGTAMRQPLLVGVVTSKATLRTRAMAINSTWGIHAPKLLFFSSEGTQAGGLPVVSLPGTNDTYPPQKKVYRMLKYMHDHYIDQYSWFMRADDDVYVRVEELVKYLGLLDPSVDMYIGQPGTGRPDDLDRIKLSLEEHFCMGGPGVIMSRSLLIKLGPLLEDCLENVVVSWNEDLEVGRCIMRRLGVMCTWNYEMRNKFYQDHSKGILFTNSSTLQADTNLPHTLTVHPLKEPHLMLRIHNYFLELELNRTSTKLRHLNKELQKLKHREGWQG